MPKVMRRFAANDVRIQTQIGIREAGRIRVDGSRSGVVLFGPYVNLAPGQYEAAIRFDPAIRPRGEAVMDVCAGSGRELLARRTVSTDSFSEGGVGTVLPFRCTGPVGEVEIRLLSETGNFVAAIEAIEIQGEASGSVDAAMFKISELPAPSVHNENRRGRNAYDGYQRGLGIGTPAIAARIKGDPDYDYARELAGARTIVEESKLLNLFLLFKFYLRRLRFGHIVEFGSFRGGSAIFMSALAQKFLPHARVYAFDTFGGMPVTDAAIDYHTEGDFAEVDLDELRQYAEAQGLSNLTFVQGKFEDTAAPTLSKIGTVALCHIDCDIRSAIECSYNQTKQRMVPGGYWVFDDPLVPTCLGAFEAIEDLLVGRDGLRAEQAWPHLVYRQPGAGSSMPEANENFRNDEQREPVNGFEHVPAYSETDLSLPLGTVIDRLSGIEGRLDRLEILGHGAGAVYIGNNRLLTRLTYSGIKLVYMVEASDRGLVPRLVADGVFEGELTQFFFHHLRNDSHCLDIGANFGYYTCIMGRCAYHGKTIAVEPDPRTFELLRNNVHINWQSEVVRPVNAAASDRPGSLTLHRRLTRSTNTSIIRLPDEDLARLGEAPSEAFTVDALAIDGLLPELAGRVDFMKIDVEGAEPLVFAGARETIAQNPQISILMEWSPDQIREAGFHLQTFTSDLAGMGLQPAVVTGIEAEPIDWASLCNTSYRSAILLRRVGH